MNQIHIMHCNTVLQSRPPTAPSTVHNPPFYIAFFHMYFFIQLFISLTYKLKYLKFVPYGRQYMFFPGIQTRYQPWFCHHLGVYSFNKEIIHNCSNKTSLSNPEARSITLQPKMRSVGCRGPINVAPDLRAELKPLRLEAPLKRTKNSNRI